MDGLEKFSSPSTIELQTKCPENDTVIETTTTTTTTSTTTTTTTTTTEAPEPEFHIYNISVEQVNIINSERQTNSFNLKQNKYSSCEFYNITFQQFYARLRFLSKVRLLMTFVYAIFTLGAIQIIRDTLRAGFTTVSPNGTWRRKSTNVSSDIFGPF